MQKPTLFFLTFGLVFLCSCGKQDTFNNSAAKQNSIEVNAKASSLAPAINNYCGTMHMTESDSDFDVTITLVRGDDNIHPSPSQNPSDTTQIPKLMGNMRFPAIKNQGSAAYSTLPELIEATGASVGISFTYGDYDPQTQTIYLPFSVGGHTGNFGEVRGTLNLANKNFKGIWYSNSFQAVGTFDVLPCTGSELL